MTRRSQIIEEVLADLERLKNDKPQDLDLQYAVQENIRFFEAAKHPFSFLRWQLFVAPNIDASRLLELADLSLPKWETVLYEGLRRMERKKFPGLLTPLVRTLVSMPGIVYLDVGCGAMETERQVIELLNKRNDTAPRVFVGVDQSPASYDVINETFSEIIDRVEIVKIADRDRESLLAALKPGSKHRIVFVEADALELEKWLSAQEVDIVYSSRFKHHLPEALKWQMDESLKKVGKFVLEYDDYRTPLSWIQQTLAAWSRPVLLNGALLSRLRQPSKKDLKAQRGKGDIHFFSPPGSYIKHL
jgi:hypothetical protein